MNPSAELLDVLDHLGNRTGRVIPRGTQLALGEYQLAVHVWLRGEDGAYLVQQRALDLPNAPGIWATTVGLATTGEGSLSAAIRELYEELGLRLPPTSFSLATRLRAGDQLEDIWIVTIDRKDVQPVLGTEVAAWRWAVGEELLTSASAGEFFPYSYLDHLVTGTMAGHPNAVGA